MAFRNNNSAWKVQSSSKGSSHYSGGYQRGGANDIEEQKKDYEQYLSKPIRERRKVYSCGKRFVPLSSVPTWGELYVKALSENPGKRHQMGTFAEADEYINGKVSVWKGDITTLEIDAIVNAANERLLGGGGVDGAIHRAAGSRLYKECKTLHGCATGGAKITYGYDLPASYVIHTVGPQYEDENLLRACYVNSLNLMLTKKLRTIAFPCISTGIYGYPNVSAAKTAISTVRQFLEKKGGDVDRIIFCVFMPEDDRCYADFMPLFFPVGEEEC